MKLATRDRRAAFRACLSVARALGVSDGKLLGNRLSYPGNHGTRAESDARAAACWVLNDRFPKLSRREIGLVVGLKHTAVRQAILRAPKRFNAIELKRFAGSRT